MPVKVELAPEVAARFPVEKIPRPDDLETSVNFKQIFQSTFSPPESPIWMPLREVLGLSIDQAEGIVESIPGLTPSEKRLLQCRLELPAPEIPKQLGVSPDSYQWKLTDIRNKLRQTIDELSPEAKTLVFTDVPKNPVTRKWIRADPGKSKVIDDLRLQEFELVRLAQDGNEAAQTALYENYFRRVYAYMHGRTDDYFKAEDLAADTMNRVIMGIGKFKERGVPFSAWVFRIAHNVWISSWRKSRARFETSFNFALPDKRHGWHHDQNLEDKVVKQMLARQILAEVDNLPPNQSQVIRLRFIEDLSVADSARIMSKSIGNVKVTQHKAIAALRKKLFANGFRDIQPKELTAILTRKAA